MTATDVFLDDAYAAYWHTVEADLDDPAPCSAYDLEDSFDIEAPQEVLDAYTEFSTMSED
jgi:hypothetical protein